MYERAGWDGALESEIREWKELYPDAVLNLESVLAYSHRKHFLRLIGSDEYFEQGSRAIVEARHAIQSLLTLSEPQEPPELYRRFVQHLTVRDTVLTFNYDTLLERTLEVVNIAYSLSPEWWLDDYSSEGNDPYSPRFIDVIKLHGSVDWYDRRYYDERREYFARIGVEVPDRDPLFGPTRRVPTESLARGPVGPELGNALLARVVRVPNHARYFPFAHSWEVAPFLLPPAHDKLLGSDPIRDLWQNMHRTQDSYSAIVMVGYSMPVYDGYAYEALGRLLIDYQAGGDRTYWGQRRVPLQVITLADSEDEVFKRIPFLRRGSVRVWTNGFSLESLAWMDWGDGESPI